MCDNHRGVSLLSVACKILALVLLMRLNNHLEQGQHAESQYGIRKGRGTTDMIFAARQLQEKFREQNQKLYTTFIDLTKAFDSVSREGLWEFMANFGCPGGFITMVRQFTEGMTASVLEDGKNSQPFAITNGVKQGFVLAPTLFSMVFTAMLADAFSEGDTEIKLRHRIDGNLFNLRRLKAITKVKETVIRDFLFADDCSLNNHTEAEMQSTVDKFSTACTNFGLTISTSTKKTEVMFQPAPGQPHLEPSITVSDKTLTAVHKFTCLGSTLSNDAVIDAEVDCRTAKASSPFGKINDTVWEHKGISSATKLKVYHAVVLTTLLYGSRTWTAYARHSRQLNHLHLRCLRKILHVKWQHKVPDTEILKRSGMPSIHTTLQKNQIRWTGQVVRSQGGQRKQYKDPLKCSLKTLDIDAQTWEKSVLAGA